MATKQEMADELVALNPELNAEALVEDNTSAQLAEMLKEAKGDDSQEETPRPGRKAATPGDRTARAKKTPQGVDPEKAAEVIAGGISNLEEATKYMKYSGLTLPETDGFGKEVEAGFMTPDGNLFIDRGQATNHFSKVYGIGEKVVLFKISK